MIKVRALKVGEVGGRKSRGWVYAGKLRRGVVVVG